MLEVGLHVIDLDYRGPDGRDYHHTLAVTPDEASARDVQIMVDVAVAPVRN